MAKLRAPPKQLKTDYPIENARRTVQERNGGAASANRLARGSANIEERARQRRQTAQLTVKCRQLDPSKALQYEQR
jgi:hypothetical protein